jgi:AcrR family transcriptional regulator
MAVSRRRAAVELPVLPSPPPALRADAARNRTKLLLAAADLFSARGVEAVSLDDVVSAAGVGKGTLYRLFGDKSGLAAALLDEQERELQERVLSGPPPLGPGAGARARLTAFIDSYVAYVAGNVDLVRMSQTARPGARFDIGSHHFWRTHLTYLLTEAGAPHPGTAADVLLAAMTAEQIDAWVRRENRGHRRVAADLRQLAEAWCRPDPRPRR